MVRIEQYVMDIKTELAAAGHGNKEGIYCKYAAILDCSKATIQRVLRKELGRKKVVKREKKISQALIDRVADIKVRGMMLTRGGGIERELSTAACIRILCEQGVDGAEDLTPSTVNRRLEEVGFRTRNVRTRVEAPFANYEWQLDFSRSKYFQLQKWDKDRRDYLLKVSGRELHYKQDDRRLRTWIVQVKESYSRIRDAKAYAAAGESTFIGLDMIHHVLNRADDDPHPLRHAPQRLKTDNGAFVKRKETQAALAAIGVDVRRAAPGNHASQGKVESGFRAIWCTFELELALKVGDGQTIWLLDYNDLLHEKMVQECSLPHPLLAGATRGAAYARSIQQNVQTYVDADILTHAFRVEERTVDASMLFSLDNIKYQTPPHAANRKIRVYKNINGDVLGELLDSWDKPFWCAPPKTGENYPYWKMDDFDHRPHNTYRQMVETRVSRQEREPYTDGKQVFMPAREQERAPVSPFAEKQQADTEFENIT